jgi:TonB family protein
MRPLLLPLLAVIAFVSACATGASQPESETPRVAESDIVPGHVYDLEQLTTAPRPTNMSLLGGMMAREYPPSLRDAGRGGEATASMVIDEEGRPVAAEISRSSGNPELDAATLRVARGIRFRPGRIGDTPVRVRVELPIHWTIRR